MKQKLKAGAVAVLIAGYALTAQAELKPGDPAPDFTTQASLGGKTYAYSLADALKKGPVVLYFYPAAFTRGCTIEAHAFADAIDRYRAYGATVIGVSADDIDTLTKFSVSECRSKFPVAADPGARIIRAYDAKLPALDRANRVSYVISPDGKILYEYTSLSPARHVENTLEAVKAWAASHRR
ncbi:thioredoxin-dependent peroxiredoxin [Burkholderia multivorans]